MSVIIDSDNNNVNITEEPINVTVSLGGPDVAAVWGGITGDLTDQTDLQEALDDKVPYTGATGDVNLGEYGIQLGNLEFDNTPTNVPTAAGSVYWSDTDGTLNMVLKGGQTISRIGETQHIRALNNTGVQIARGKVVYVVGAQGQRLTIALADADTEILSKDTIGITSEDIADGAEGFVIVQGVINNISTTGMSDGATVYLSQTAGGYTTTPPVDPAHLVVLGFIVNGNSGGAGSIYVKVDNGYELGELHDVNTTGATNGQVLTYNGTTWVPATNGSGTVTSIETTAPITGGTITTSGTIGITQAGAAADGYLSSADWNTFNNKQAALTNPVTGTGTAGQVSYWSGTGTQTGSNNLFWDAANGRLGIATNAPTTTLDVNGNINTSGNVVINNNSNIRHFAIRGTDTGGWARVYRFLGSSGTEYGGLFANGNVDSLNYYTVGPTSTNGLTIQQNGNGSIGTASAIANTKFTVRGSGTTSATTALLVQNGTPTDLFRIYDNGTVVIGTGLAGFATLTDGLIIRSNLSGTSSGTDITLSSAQGTNASTSGISNVVLLRNGATQAFNPTSGTGVFNVINIPTTINQTGGANGITRGLYVNPTLTSAADWRSVEFSNNTGWGLYGAGTALNYLGGSTSIGTTTNSARLHVRGSGTTSATTALLVQNSTPSNLLTVTDDGRTAFGSSASSVQVYPSGVSDNTLIGGDSLTFNVRGNINSLTHGGVTFSGDTSAITSGNHNVVAITKPFSPTSGSAGFRYLSISPVINQTGGANGITRGLYVNPTLTSAADWRSVETSNNTGWAAYFAGTADLFFNDATDLQFGTTTGTKIGTATSQKIGLWNATPIVQPTTAIAAATRVGGGGTTVTDTDTFDGYTIAQIVKALRNMGALA